MLLGHFNLNITRIYITPSQAELADMISQLGGKFFAGQCLLCGEKYPFKPGNWVKMGNYLLKSLSNNIYSKVSN
ncbi:MAG: hypothetical protein ACTSRS_21520 [Candidatus Helarchaeota archaeon]